MTCPECEAECDIYSKKIENGEIRLIFKNLTTHFNKKHSHLMPDDNKPEPSRVEKLQFQNAAKIRH